MEEVSENGPRVRKLHAAFEKTLEKSLQGFTREKFLQCFDTPDFTDETKLLDELKTTLESSLRSEFETICKDRDAIKKLNQLDELINRQLGAHELEKLNSEDLEIDCPPISDDLPSRAMMKKRIEIKQAERDRLAKLLQQLEEENKAFQSTINTQQKQKQKLEKEVTSQTGHISQALKVVEDVESLDLPSAIEQLKNELK